MSSLQRSPVAPFVDLWSIVRVCLCLSHYLIAVGTQLSRCFEQGLCLTNHHHPLLLATGCTQSIVNPELRWKLCSYKRQHRDPLSLDCDLAVSQDVVFDIVQMLWATDTVSIHPNHSWLGACLSYEWAGPCCFYCKNDGKSMQKKHLVHSTKPSACIALLKTGQPKAS